MLQKYNERLNCWTRIDVWIGQNDIFELLA